MRVCVRTFLVLACLLAVQSTAWAQATIAGLVKDASGAVLPGVTVEAASPALIEKVRTTVTDGTGRYRIENLQPGTYAVTFTLPGFVNLRRDGVLVGGTGVIAIDGELRVGGVQETVTVTGETPVVDIHEHEARDHARQRNDARAAERPQLQLPADHGARAADERQQRQQRPGVRDLPDPRRPRRRVAPHRRGDEHQQPAWRQPAAELRRRHRQRPGSHDDHVGRTRRVGDRGPHDEHRPATGRQQHVGPVLRVRFLRGDAVEQLHARTAAARRHSADAADPRLRREPRRGRSDRARSALVLHERARAGIAAEHPQHLLQPERGQRERLGLRAGSQPAGVLRPHVGELHAAHHLAGAATATSSRSRGTSSTSAASARARRPSAARRPPNTSPEADGKGEFSPQRVQTGRWTSPLTNRLLLEAGFGTTYYQWAGKENDPNPTRDLVRVVGQNTPVIPGSAPVTVTYRSQNWYENYTRGTNWAAAANYVTGSHSVKVGYQGNHWRDDREHVRQHHEHCSTRSSPGFRARSRCTRTATR